MSGDDAGISSSVPADQRAASDEGEHTQAVRPDRVVGRWRDRYQGSIAQDLVKGLGETEFGNWIILFGASFLLSVLPLIILLNALANSRVDDDIATRLGLNREGSHVIDSLFSASHAGWNFGVVLALALSLAGTIAVARSVQRLYQQVFDQPDVRGWSNVARCLVWALAVAAEVYVDAVISRPLRDLPGGRVFLGLGNLVIATALFWLGLHLLLRGKETWRRLFPAALATGVFWVGLGAFASFYFSSTLLSDSHLYGTIGVVFTLLTWFIAMGAVITLGTVVGHVWIVRRSPLAPASVGGSDVSAGDSTNGSSDAPLPSSFRPALSPDVPEAQ